jgi:ankyrin repeat protein
MKRVSLLGAALLFAASASAFAQQKDTRGKVTLPMPPAHTPAVADAAQNRDAAAVKKLIAQGADVNIPEGDGMTALHWAAEHGDSAMTMALLRARADVKATTRIGSYTPLQLASRSGSPAVVKVLLAAGADPNRPDANGATALHLAAAAGSPEAVSALLEKGANPNARESEWGQTPLFFAAENDRAAAIKALIAKGADPSLRSNVANLQEDAARDQAGTKKRNEVLISFMPQARRDSVTAAAKAQARADSIALAEAGPGAAQFARRAGGGGGGGGRGGPQPKGPFTAAQVQAAIDSGRIAEAARPAANVQVTEEVDTLNGGVAGYNGTVGGIGGFTALHHAARQGNVEAARALLDGGADVNDTSRVDHTTPLLIATINGQFDVAMLLVQRGANPNIASNVGMTPLYATINTQWAPKSRYPQPQAIQNQKATYLDLMKALLDAKANVNAKLGTQPWYFAFNNCGNANCGLEYLDGSTAFWRAAYAVDVDAMKLLEKYGADPNVPAIRAPQAGGRGGRGGRGGAAGGRGAPPGDIAAFDSATRAAQFGRGGGGGGGGGGRGAAPILDPAIDSAAKAAPVGLGVYAIHAAAGVGYGNGFAGNSHRHAPDGWMPAMRYLVEELHADVNARDARGMTPLHHAAARGDNEMIMYLVAHGADPRAVSRDGHTTVDMANGPVQRLRPFPETIALLEKLGAKNQHRCVSC